MRESFKTELDRTDLYILRALQDDGRLNNADLARLVNASPATTHRRTQRLFEQGYIKSVRADVAADKVGLGVLVMVGVVLDRSTPESFAAFEAAVSPDEGGAGLQPCGRGFRLSSEDQGGRHVRFQQVAR
jgi:Lrp/AsnC family leucine-responsive transcriptional regulator